MSAKLVALADAVVGLLRDAPAGTFTRIFEPERHYAPVHDLVQLGSLRVLVVPAAVATARATRGQLLEEQLAIDVGVQQRVDSPEDKPELDRLMLLVQQIKDYLLKTAVSDPEARADSVANDPAYDPDELLEKRLFVSVVTVNYRLWR